MSEQNHPWCSNVARDEAIRAAEDAAAAERTQPPDHRDIQQAVAALLARVDELERKHNRLATMATLDAGWNPRRLANGWWFPKGNVPAPPPPPPPPPPRLLVRRPRRDVPPQPGGVVHLRDKEWIAAIRAAGGEVE